MIIKSVSWLGTLAHSGTHACVRQLGDTSVCWPPCLFERGLNAGNDPHATQCMSGRAYSMRNELSVAEHRTQVRL